MGRVVQDDSDLGLLHRPDVRSTGWIDRGRRIVAGRIDVDGGPVEGVDPFASDLPAAGMAELHGFGWLDDLAALGTPAARAAAQGLVLAWLARDRGERGGIPWRIDVIGARLAAWVVHAGMILPGLDRAGAAPVLRGMAAQLALLDDAPVPQAPDAALRVAAGRAMAAVILRGGQLRVAPALAALGEAAVAAAGHDGGRCPEALLDRAALMVQAGAVIVAAGHPAPDGLRRAREALLPVLAGLRHADGGLVRAHGGGAGAPGRLDHALGATRVMPDDMPLGFVRLLAGGTTVMLDAATPPEGRLGHAGTLAVEVTIGHHPVIVACGSGHRFGPDWADAGRASAAHSGLVLGGESSARLGGDGGLQARPEVTIEPRDTAAAEVAARHDGWQSRHGVIHSRSLQLEADGLALHGQDQLIPATAQGGAGVDASLHFHLHPGIRAEARDGAIALTLPDGEAWQLGYAPRAEAAIEPSVWLEPSEAAPVPSSQVVLRLQAGALHDPLDWSLLRVG